MVVMMVVGGVRIKTGGIRVEADLIEFAGPIAMTRPCDIPAF